MCVCVFVIYICACVCFCDIHMCVFVIYICVCVCIYIYICVYMCVRVRMLHYVSSYMKLTLKITCITAKELFKRLSQILRAAHAELSVPFLHTERTAGIRP
jgi:hypothetical protein